jgi:hexosaminidase
LKFAKRHRWALAAIVVILVGVAVWAGVRPSDGPRATLSRFAAGVVPAPVSAVAASGVTFRLTSTTTISADVPSVGTYLAGILRSSTGYPMSIVHGGEGTITLRLAGAPTSVGSQGYQLTVSGNRVVIEARQAAGLFAGVQTLLLLLPPAVQGSTVASGPWTVPGGTILDYPRFAYRGAMLDVARHFFGVGQVERYVDEIAQYKINYLHLHLSDDQGWRIAINGWPDLTTRGGSTEVGGGAGGYYTQADYSAIVAHAASRYITVIPEIDMPGHTNAALASYTRLNCEGQTPRLYTGIDVGFSSLCVPRDLTYAFIDTVIGQLAALTPGPYIHIGGDESSATPAADYASFIDRAQRIVQAHGKTVIGWHNIAGASLLPSTVAEFWDTEPTNAPLAAAVAAGTTVIMSPANHTYLDMKYTDQTTLGQTWAGLDDVDTAYGWDPGTYVPGVPASSVLGVEAPLWTETIVTSADIDYMAFPRLPAIAELGWSPWRTHDQAAFETRLGAQGPRWRIMGINYYHSAQVSWPAGS